MVIASNALPFEVYLIANPTVSPKRIELSQWFDTNDILIDDENCATIEENDELDLYFNSSIAGARLYFDALDCCPSTYRILSDDNGLVYCTPSIEALSLYRSDSNYDALRVDTLQLTVQYEGKHYFSFLKVSPKQLSLSEWTMMRDELEKEITGLSQDLVHRNIGLGKEFTGVIPPDELYSFFVISKYANSIISALLDIKDKPKYVIKKEYERAPDSQTKEIDSVTVRNYLRNGTRNNSFIVPVKRDVYDIQENRLLKKIIMDYDKRMDRFINVINNSIEYHKQICVREGNPENGIYEKRYIEILSEYLSTAIKLKKITGILKTEEWFKGVSLPQDVFVPHSFAMDSRYGKLFRLFSEINKEEFKIKLNSQYSYSWKKSSTLYEMWCFISICRYLINGFPIVHTDFDSVFLSDQLFPYLKTGTKISVEDDICLVEAVYDNPLPRKSSGVRTYTCPLYMTGQTGNHYRPDICINIYYKKAKWYVGSIIIECKYRKLTSFWEGNTRNSKRQIKTYFNDSKSPIYYGGKFPMFQTARPVQNVLVFTPDVFEDRSYPDDHVSLHTYKVSEDRSYIEKCGEAVLNLIHSYVLNADQFYEQIHPVSDLDV